MTFDDFLIDNEISIVLCPMPAKIHGFCTRKDGWTVIYLNQRLSDKQLMETCKHELLHATCNHLQSFDFKLCEHDVQEKMKTTQLKFE